MLLGRAHQHSLLRYDARGIGLSQRDNVEISFDKWVSDLEAIVDCAKLDRFILFGLSQGAAQAIVYAARHPERLTHLILYGGFARGYLHRENPEKEKEALEAVETRQITVDRTFLNFEEFWDITVSGAPSIRPTFAAMSPADIELLKTRVSARLPIDAAGRISYASRANAIRGRVPA
jgi:pimeloyl-ACP methyl ester carboxylesterase